MRRPIKRKEIGSPRGGKIPADNRNRESKGDKGLIEFAKTKKGGVGEGKGLEGTQKVCNYCKGKKGDRVYNS